MFFNPTRENVDRRYCSDDTCYFPFYADGSCLFRRQCFYAVCVEDTETRLYIHTRNTCRDLVIRYGYVLDDVRVLRHIRVYCGFCLLDGKLPVVQKKLAGILHIRIISDGRLCSYGSNTCAV